RVLPVPEFLKQQDPEPLVGLARFPPGCVDEHWQPLPGGSLFVVGSAAASKGPGRMVVVGGHSAFMNNMMLRRDNGNLDFAWNCVHWLTENRKRKHVLFIESGNVVTDLNVPLVHFPLPILKVISKALRRLENENQFNRLILDNVERERIVRGLVVGLTVLLGVYGLFRLVRAHHRGEPAAPLVAGRVGGGEAPLPAATRRRQAQIVEGNYWEAARALARLCFEGEGAAPPPDGPPVVAHGPRRLRRLVGRLWQLAYGGPQRVS